MLPRSPVAFQHTLDVLLDGYITELKDAKNEEELGIGNQETAEKMLTQNYSRNRMLKVMEDIYFCELEYFVGSTNKIR